MGSELLKKEKEYRDLNDKLESRARELLKEVDDVMKFQDHFLVSSQSAKTFEQSKNRANDVCAQDRGPQKTRSAPLPRKTAKAQLDPAECKELNIPEDVNNMGPKGLVHFLKARLKKMQGDYEKLTSDYKNKNEEFKRVYKDNQRLQDEKEKWLQNTQNGKNLATKMENQVTVLQSKLQTKEAENATLRKEVDQLHKELKAAKLGVSTIEVKYNRALEECERAKTSLRSAKQEEKDVRENSRKQIQELTGVLKRIEKHKTELLNGFRKQLLLIDNLKKQKAHIECYKLIEKGDNDFLKILDWKIEDTGE